MVWLMALMGIIASFLVKYIKRNNKEKTWSFLFWLEDNWAETVVSILFMVMLVIIFQRSEFDNAFLTDKYPWVKTVPVDLIAAGLSGYLNNSLWYAIVKKFKTK